MTILDAVEIGWHISRREARTLIQQGGIRVHGGKKVTDPTADFESGSWLYRKRQVRQLVERDGLVIVYDPIGWEYHRWKEGEFLAPDNEALAAERDLWFKRHGPYRPQHAGYEPQHDGPHRDWTRCPCNPDVIAVDLISQEVLDAHRDFRLPTKEA